MMEGQRDSEAGEIEKGGEGTPWLNKKDVKKGKEEGKIKSWGSSGKNKRRRGKLM